jgi:hypothetical protein
MSHTSSRFNVSILLFAFNVYCKMMPMKQQILNTLFGLNKITGSLKFLMNNSVDVVTNPTLHNPHNDIIQINTQAVNKWYTEIHNKHTSFTPLVCLVDDSYNLIL